MQNLSKTRARHKIKSALPLFSWAEMRARAELSPAARPLSRRYGLSASTALMIAISAGYRCAEDLT